MILKKVIISINILFSLFFLMGCPNNFKETMGKTIENIPSWAYEYVYSDPFSEWKQWNNSNKLHSYLSNDFDLDTYDGKYRLLVIGQFVGIEFENGNAGEVLYVWLEDAYCDDYFVTIPQKKEDEFVFSGYLKTSIEEEPTKKAEVIFSKIETKNSYSTFNYSLKVEGNEIINENFKSLKKDYFNKNAVPEWASKIFSNENKEYEFNYSYDDSFYLGLNSFSLLKYNFDSLGKLHKNELLYHGGMKEISVDEANKIVEYELFDGSPKAEHFLEIKILEDEKESLWTWFDKDAEGNRINERKETLYTYCRE